MHFNSRNENNREILNIVPAPNGTGLSRFLVMFAVEDFGE
jgi:hypothetical protein